MVERGIDPYPMPYDQARVEHKRFQRWAVTRAYRNIPWEAYNPSASGKLRDPAIEPDIFEGAQ